MSDVLDALTLAEQRLEDYLSRRSVSPKRLRAPGPDADELEAIVQAALRAPDHGGLLPWRLVEFRPETRELLARCFEEEKLRRDSLAGELDLRQAREHATRAPMLLAFVVCPRRATRVPMRDQWLGAGAALGNVLGAAHRLGYGAIMLSGERCFDPILCGQLGVGQGEYLAGFISIGTIAEPPPPARERLSQSVLSRWPGQPRVADQAMRSSDRTLDN
jgi:nitroreductase